MDGDREVGDWEWCRSYIDHNCILRCRPGEPLLTTGDGSVNSWQFYFPVATLNAEFMERVAKMFWRDFGEEEFQLCGCESGGVPVVCSLQAHANIHGRNVNAFMIKKRAKSYGIGNWLEGIVLPDVPVLLVDDVTGTGTTLKTQGQRLVEFGLTLHPRAFAIAAAKQRQEAVDTVFAADDFHRTFGQYVRRYDRMPQFAGVLA